jgi:mono/diheme cytochrome c family protein
VKFKYLFAILTIIFAVTTYSAQEQKPAEEKPSEPPAAEAQKPAEAQAPAVPHGFQITPEQAAQKNPLRFSEISVERGKKIYATQCSMCHGEKGDGKGDLAEEMKINPPDFTKPETLAKRTDGELFTIIRIGNTTMPAQGERMKDIHKWEVVNYLRSLSGKTPLKSTEEEMQQGTVVVKEKEKEKDKNKD